MDTIPFLCGSVLIESKLSLEALAEVLSSRLFRGLPFIGKEKNLYEEIPAIYIDGNFLGLSVILSGGQESGYQLEVLSNFFLPQVKKENIYLDGYLFELLKKMIEPDDDILIKATKQYGEKCYP